MLTRIAILILLPILTQAQSLDSISVIMDSIGIYRVYTELSYEDGSKIITLSSAKDSLTTFNELFNTLYGAENNLALAKILPIRLGNRSENFQAYNQAIKDFSGKNYYSNATARNGAALRGDYRVRQGVLDFNVRADENLNLIEINENGEPIQDGRTGRILMITLNNILFEIENVINRTECFYLPFLNSSGLRERYLSEDKSLRIIKI